MIERTSSAGSRRTVLAMALATLGGLATLAQMDQGQVAGGPFDEGPDLGMVPFADHKVAFPVPWDLRHHAATVISRNPK